MNKARKEILDRLQGGHRKKQSPLKPDFLSPMYHPLGKDLPAMFKDKMEAVSGHVHICEDLNQLISELRILISNIGTEVYCNDPELHIMLSENNVPVKNERNIPETIKAGITDCECLVAHLGAVVVSSALKSGRKMFVYPPIHIVIASKKQIVGHLEDAYQFLSDKYKDGLPSLITTITGPSRTADIEKTLIIGMHGPKEVHVFIS